MAALPHVIEDFSFTMHNYTVTISTHSHLSLENVIFYANVYFDELC